MRDWNQVQPQFWTGQTGRSLRGSSHAQLLALYLITCSSANSIGLYRLPLVLAAHDIGMTPEQAQTAMGILEEHGFARYDSLSECVWVVTMAARQWGQLDQSDNRVKMVRSEWAGHESQTLKAMFREMYDDWYKLDGQATKAKHTKRVETPLKPLRSPFEAPSKPLQRGEDKSATPFEAPPKPENAFATPFEGASEPLRQSERESEREKERERGEEPPAAPLILKGQDAIETLEEDPNFRVSEPLPPEAPMVRRVRDAIAYRNEEIGNEAVACHMEYAAVLRSLETPLQPMSQRHCLETWTALALVFYDRGDLAGAHAWTRDLWEWAAIVDNGKKLKWRNGRDPFPDPKAMLGAPDRVEASVVELTQRMTEKKGYYT